MLQIDIKQDNLIEKKSWSFTTKICFVVFLFMCIISSYEMLRNLTEIKDEGEKNGIKILLIGEGWDWSKVYSSGWNRRFGINPHFHTIEDRVQQFRHIFHLTNIPIDDAFFDSMAEQALEVGEQNVADFVQTFNDELKLNLQHNNVELILMDNDKNKKPNVVGGLGVDKLDLEQNFDAIIVEHIPEQYYCNDVSIQFYEDNLKKKGKLFFIGYLNPEKLDFNFEKVDLKDPVKRLYMRV